MFVFEWFLKDFSSECFDKLDVCTNCQYFSFIINDWFAKNEIENPSNFFGIPILYYCLASKKYN